MKLSVGEYKGRNLAVASHIRPTQQQARQALFSILYGHIEGARVLDLCSGTGAWGIEALSLGAAHSSMVDIDTRILSKNCAFLPKERYQVVKSDCRNFLKRCKESYDLIFLDPPWREAKLYTESLKAIFDSDILSEAGYLVVEHRHDRHGDGDEFDLDSYPIISETRQYGDTVLRICRYE